MIYNGQRINKVNIYKVKGSKDYILADESEYPSLVAPIIRVDSNDGEYINKIIHRMRVNGGCGFMANMECSTYYLQNCCYQVPWAKVPKAWKGLYKGEIVNILIDQNRWAKFTVVPF